MVDLEEAALRQSLRQVQARWWRKEMKKIHGENWGKKVAAPLATGGENGHNPPVNVTDTPRRKRGRPRIHPIDTRPKITREGSGLGTGIYLHPKCKTPRYLVRVHARHLGTFNTLEEAQAARLRAMEGGA